LQPNRKWKYGVSRLNELAIHDFLFDFNTIYGPNCHRLAARNYFWSRRHRKWRHQTLFNVQEDSNSLQWTGRGYFRSPKTTSGREITISGLTSSRPLTSVALCGGLLVTTQRMYTFIQYTDLTTTVWPLGTTSGLGATGSGDIRPRLTSKSTLTFGSGPEEANSGLRKLLPVG